MGGRLRRERSETPLAEKASAFFDSLGPAGISRRALSVSCEIVSYVPWTARSWACFSSDRRWFTAMRRMISFTVSSSPDPSE